MGTTTNISWTDTTWNPVIGCSKVSRGCKNCYAEQLSMTPKMKPFGYTGLPWTAKNALLNVQLKPERLDQPLHWTKPRRVFVNSMSDLFHELVPDEYIDKVFAVMMLADRHIFQILTKRAERMQLYMTTPGRFIEIMKALESMFESGQVARPKDRGYLRDWPFKNVWLGVSVEDQRAANERIPHLLQTPCAVRFLSCEPLLGPVDLWSPTYPWPDAGSGLGSAFAWGQGVGWVIVGGESGPKRRPMDLAWARSIRDDCAAAGVPFFYKQEGGARSETGKLLDGKAYNEMPVSAGVAK